MSVHQLPTRVHPGWTFGDRVRKVRRLNRLTQLQFAKIMGFKAASVDSWESDRNLPRELIETATKIEDHFGLARGWMLGYADVPGGGQGNRALTWGGGDSNPEPDVSGVDDPDYVRLVAA